MCITAHLTALCCTPTPLPHHTRLLSPTVRMVAHNFWVCVIEIGVAESHLNWKKEPLDITSVFAGGGRGGCGLYVFILALLSLNCGAL